MPMRCYASSVCIAYTYSHVLQKDFSYWAASHATIRMNQIGTNVTRHRQFNICLVRFIDYNSDFGWISVSRTYTTFVSHSIYRQNVSSSNISQLKEEQKNWEKVMSTKFPLSFLVWALAIRVRAKPNRKKVSDHWFSIWIASKDMRQIVWKKGRKKPRPQ